MRRAALALLLLPALPGCLATRTDVQQIQTQIDQLRVAQDQLMRELREQRELEAQGLDSLSRQATRTRGDIANRMLQMERQLVQIQELTGQGQQAVAQLRQQLRERERAQEQDRARADTAAPAPPTADAGEAEEVYNTALAAYRRSSFSTAREGFEEFLRVAPRHRLAPDAQFYVAETLAQGGAGQADRAVQAFGQVVEQHPASPRAPTALFRLAQVELGRGRRDEARARFNQLVRAYPNSADATRARQELQRMGSR